LKEAWARNYFRGQRGQWMVLAQPADQPVGFLQLLAAPDGGLIIDLIGVEGHSRRLGAAAAMIAFATQHCRPLVPIVVGTQAANVASLRLYSGLGFLPEATTYVLHRLSGDTRDPRRR
jgi:ribosomal protein S18 acetylase RimI-like enzyme